MINYLINNIDWVFSGIGVNIVLNNFVRNHDSYGQYLKNWPLIEREKLPIPPPLKFPHREGEKMVRQAIIGGRFL